LTGAEVDVRPDASVFKTIVIATAVSGTLDILFAMILTLMFGREVGDMLRYVASGPVPAATGMGAAGAILGLAVHFSLMAMMAAGLIIAAARRPKLLLASPVRAGIAFGLVTYFIMNWLVVPLRFGTPLPPAPVSIATQLFAHVVLVGIPIALLAARHFRARTT
jgi:hypothetical protein